MSDKNIADLERAVEEAWDKYDACPCVNTNVGVIEATRPLLAARRAARDAGMVPVLVSREAVEALRALHARIYDGVMVGMNPKQVMGCDLGDPVRLVALLARDLAAVLALPPDATGPGRQP